MKAKIVRALPLGVLIALTIATGIWVSSAAEAVIETKIAFDRAEALKTLGNFTPEQREAYRTFQQRDFLFLVVYGITLLIANIKALTWKGASRKRFLWQSVLLVVPVAAAACDLVEDLTILAWLNDTKPLETALDAAWWWGLGKFTFFAIAILVPVLLTAHRFLKKRTADHEKYQNKDSIDRTYYTLRAALAALVILLLGALLVRTISLCWCIRGSISAYYYTALQPMFVGTLIAVGICLIVYQGTTYIENILLDTAGFLAFIVAFVPTAPGDPRCPESLIKSGISKSDDIRLEVVQYNVFPLLVVALAATLWALLARYGAKPPDGDDKARTAWRHELIRLRTGLCAEVVAIFWFACFHENSRDMAHGVAAFGLFACIIGVVWSNHLSRRGNPGYNQMYLVVAVIMAGTLLSTAVLHFIYKWPVAIFYVEVGLIVEFALFWILQTKDLKGKPNPATTTGGAGG
ncbi:hypothetical protein G7043_16065 [Lentzea sp. NEAU-D13]|uniref:Uncharacterized protein n=1 Tax=Lentzea alba TaxID=2714351 RepID=A0A7C9RPW8_9PSEU|nr:hypothetical protein [Lentzea alba]NGY60445.1 hypothetical protein [Lentzea alba]